MGAKRPKSLVLKKLFNNQNLKKSRLHCMNKKIQKSFHVFFTIVDPDVFVYVKSFFDD